MEVIIIPPYSNVNVTQSAWEHELIAEMNKRGELDGVKVDIAEGYPTEYSGGGRGADFTAFISVGAIKKVKEYSECGKYDALIVLGDLEPGFYATQMISKIPVVYSIHAAAHVASLIGERFSIISVTDDLCHVVRRLMQDHGFGNKLVSVRPYGISSTQVFRFTQKYKKGERDKVPEGKKIIDAITTQCVAAIEKEMADSLILECPAVQILWEEVRQKLDDMGYREIQIIRSFPAAVEMARVMVNMKLMPAPRAYPSESLKAKPEHR